jgi:hypothetical protein
MQDGDIRDLAFLPARQPGVRLLGIGAGGGDDDEFGLLAATLLEEEIDDALRRGATALDDERALADAFDGDGWRGGDAGS